MIDGFAKSQIGVLPNLTFYETVMIDKSTRILSPAKGMVFLGILLSFLLVLSVCSDAFGGQHVYYSVQVAAFKFQESADRRVSELKREGKDAFWKIVELNGQRWHRILIGRFSNMNDVEAYRRQLEKEASKTFFVRKILDGPPISQSSQPPPRPLKGDGKTAISPAPVAVKTAPPKPEPPPADRMAPQPVPETDRSLPSPSQTQETPPAAPLTLPRAVTAAPDHPAQTTPTMPPAPAGIKSVKASKTPLSAADKAIPPEPPLPLPAAAPAPPPETMPPKVQTASEAPDGQRFVDQGDGTISDRRMNLMWIKNGWRLDFFSAVDWHKAVEKCVRFKHGGYSDWRLPTLAEWESIIDPSQEYPALVEPNPFENIIAHMPYWSQTEYAYKGRYGAAGEKAIQAYTVMLYYGSINHQRKSDRAFVLPVRSLK